MFRFHNPEYLLLFVIPIVLILLFVFSRIVRRRRMKDFGKIEILRLLCPDFSLARRNVKFWLLFAAITIVIFLLARPQFGTKIETIKKQGVEIMVALDVSNSMMAQDILPNRLEKAKMMLGRLVDKLSDDRIGLVVFAGNAYTQLPITADYVSAKMFFSTINPSLVSVQGTAIGAALNLSLNSFTDNQECEKAIILLTDGENHEDDAVGAASAAAEKGIRVHVIGVGSPGGSPIPEAGTSSYLKDAEGNVVVTALNESMCQQIAKAGQGIYVRADNSFAALKALENAVESMKKSEITGSAYSAYDEQFQSIALIVLILLIIEFILLEKKNPLFRNIRLFQKK